MRSVPPFIDGLLETPLSQRTPLALSARSSVNNSHASHPSLVDLEIKVVGRYDREGHSLE